MIFHKQDLLRQEIEAIQTENSTLGLVPTMGALHEGHISLIIKALEENDLVVVSIFVNPTQFDNASDLKKYPRTLEEDAQLLSKVKGQILIYAPAPEEVYSNNIVSKRYSFGGIEHQMEGKFREGHFDGVGTVLNLLFRAVKPDSAYFGEKDYQQLLVVKRLVAIEKLPVRIVGCPILREPSGLAMSSRNKRLTPTLFQEAAFIYTVLLEAQDRFKHQSIAEIKSWVEQSFHNNEFLKLEYFEIAATKNLKASMKKRRGTTYRAFIAVYAGEVRLIDNIALSM